jgi:TPR repeat protein
MLYKNRFKILFGLFVCFCLAYAAYLATRETWDSTKRFEKTGLLAHPGESAEEILMRAHRRDTDAMFLAGTGYTWRACGFPPDGDIADAWARQLMATGNSAAASHINLQILFAQNFPDIHILLGYALAECSLAQKSPYTAISKNAGLVDLDGLCSKLKEAGREYSDWEKDYTDRLATLENQKNRVQDAMRLMRELRTRPATRDEQETVIAFAQDTSTDIVLFFSATTHTPEKEPPNWSAEKLLDFIATQREHLEKERQNGGGEMLAMFVELVQEAEKAVERNLLYVPGDKAYLPTLLRCLIAPDDPLSLIPKAHLGDIPSIYALAQHYANGTSGFIRDATLSDYWLQHAAKYGDTKATLLLATRLFVQGEFTRAWAWASIAQNESSTDATTKIARNLTTQIESIQGVEKACDREERAIHFLDESIKLMEWRQTGKWRRTDNAMVAATEDAAHRGGKPANGDGPATGDNITVNVH